MEHNPYAPPRRTETAPWLFTVPPGRRSALQVILWWEKRRFLYNVIAGSVGIVSLLLFGAAIIHSGVLKPGEDAVEPILIMAAPFLLNVAYTAGWITELAVRLVRPAQANTALGPTLLGLGLALTVGLELLPPVAWGIYWALHATGLRR